MPVSLNVFPKSVFGRILITSMMSFLLLVLVASFILRDQIYQSLLDPGIPFQTYKRPAPPNYSQTEGWAHWVETEDKTSAAVFFIHPTTYDGGVHWNAPYDREQEIEEINRVILPNWAAPFVTETSRLYAPYYRQASLYAFMNNREDSQQARRLAYGDVSRAFTVFLNQLDEHTPFILVGIGQGSLHGLRLLMDFVDPNEDISRRMTAAYLLEAPTPIDLFESELSNLPICQSPEQIRCVISYAAVAPDEKERISMLSERSMSWTASRRLTYVTGRGLVCVNPLIWNTSEDYAPERLHLGGAAAENLSLSDTPSPMANQTGAQCQNGLLITEKPRTRALRRAGRLGEDRRVPLFNLFYMDLKTDAERRMDIAGDVLAEEARYAPPLMAPIEVGKSEFKPIDG